MKFETFEYLHFWILWFSFPLHTKLTVFEKAISIIHPWGALLPSPSERAYCSFSLSLIGDDRLWFKDIKTSAMGEPEVGSEDVDHLRPEQPHPPLQLQPRCLLACHRWDSCCIFSLITHTHTYHISIQDLFITRQDSIQYTYSGLPRILWYKLPQIHY